MTKSIYHRHHRSGWLVSSRAEQMVKSYEVRHNVVKTFFTNPVIDWRKLSVTITALFLLPKLFKW